MRVRVLPLLILAAAAALSACAPAAPNHDKAYYMENADERGATLSACRTDPGRLAGTPNCVNAQAANADAHALHVYDTPAPAARVGRPEKL